jgi:ABC-type sugar transport system substrate-binding protein
MDFKPLSNLLGLTLSSASLGQLQQRIADPKFLGSADLEILCGALSDETALICWYGMMPHPYMTLVQKGVEARAKVYKVKIYTTVGQEWTQANETQNVEALSTRDIKLSASFPVIRLEQTGFSSH